MKEKRAETTLLEEYVTSLRMGEAKTYRNISVIPVFSDRSMENGFTTLDDAIKTDRFSVTELNEGGSVPELRVTNLLDTDVLIIDGEELVGAKQNRVVNTTIIIGKGEKVVIPVSCVEQNRWHYRSKKFSSGKSNLYAALRKKKSMSVHKNLKQSASFCSDQREIWDDIRDKQASFAIHSDTDSMSDIYESRDSEIGNYEEQFKPEAGQIGFITVIAGKIAGADIFGSRLVLSRIYGKLLRGYILDALDQKQVKGEGAGPKVGDKAGEGKNIADEVSQFLRSVSAAPKEAFKSVGSGQELRFDDKKVSGFALVNDDDVVHLAAFTD